MFSKVWQFPEEHLKWPTGEWDLEIDKMQWTDEKTGYFCVLVRGPLGHLCGYTSVPKSHPAFGKDYDDLSLDVHGGLTWGSSLEQHPIFDLEPEDEKDLWIFGFDCGHLDDITPGLTQYNIYPSTTSYKNVAFVIKETQSLASQLKEMEKKA